MHDFRSASDALDAIFRHDEKISGKTGLGRLSDDLIESVRRAARALGMADEEIIDQSTIGAGSDPARDDLVRAQTGEALSRIFGPSLGKSTL